MSNQHLHCPKCGQIDRVEKVSAIYSGGITQGYFSGPSVALNTPIGKGQSSISSAYTTLSGSSQSRLSQELAPPVKPVVKGVSKFGIFTSLVLIGGGVYIFGMMVASLNLRGGGDLPSNFSEIFYGLALFVLLFGLTCGLGTLLLIKNINDAKRRKKEFNTSTLRLWKRAIARWQNLYYCGRDDGVFDPDERLFVPIDEMIDHIYDDD